MSPGMEGSRSGGLIASTWASMVSLGREGYREHAREIFETAAVMMDVVRSHPELRIMGDGTSGAPTFCYSFTSDAFEIYHLVDFLGPKGWRFNGQQYPNAIHMAVTRPQTRAGVVELFATDLADAIAYAKEKHAAGEEAFAGAIYGGAPGGLGSMDRATSDFIVAVMDDMLDKQQGLPPA
jgi:sphinganine-1-phosphate aldolase